MDMFQAVCVCTTKNPFQQWVHFKENEFEDEHISGINVAGIKTIAYCCCGELK